MANGEVWSEADWARCRAESGLADVMLGRGAVADPFLARRLRGGAPGLAAERAGRHLEVEWAELWPLLLDFWRGVQAKVLPRHAPGRLKQWLNLLRRRYPQAAGLYARIRLARSVAEIDRELAAAAPWPLAA